MRGTSRDLPQTSSNKTFLPKLSRVFRSVFCLQEGALNALCFLICITIPFWKLKKANSRDSRILYFFPPNIFSFYRGGHHALCAVGDSSRHQNVYEYDESTDAIWKEGKRKKADFTILAYSSFF